MRHAGHIRARSEGTYELIWNLGTAPLTGKRLSKSKTFKGTYKEAEAELRRTLKSIDDNTYVAPSKLTVETYLTDWLAAVKARVSPKTHERYAEIVTNFLIPKFGKCVLNKLSAQAVQTEYNKWEYSGRRDKKAGGLSPRTRLHIHRIFFAALKQAEKIPLIARNPLIGVIAPRARKKAVNALTVEQSAVLLKALRNTSVYYPVMLALVTGMRRGEILALRWKNVDFDNKIIRVVESLEQVGTVLRFKEPKTGKTRAVMLPDLAVEILKKYKEEQKKRLTDLKVKFDDEALVCSRFHGEPLKPDSLTQEFRVAVRRVPDFPIIRFHDLRHSHATQMLARGIHPKIAQERLGHSTIATTLDIYSHVTNTMQDEAVSRMDKAFKTAINSQINKTLEPS